METFIIQADLKLYIDRKQFFYHLIVFINMPYSLCNTYGNLL